MITNDFLSSLLKPAVYGTSLVYSCDQKTNTINWSAKHFSSYVIKQIQQTINLYLLNFIM